ncbi:hypothetical protein HUK84_00910 [Nguyenibacter vanlangensis]|uniref:Uncharacterized protein n=2 Tax=Nguyenibacter vanlangensis TaxID=1216886 RepID=A0A7Y7ISX6_9PROT|nr:hypothetical protein [Nguyenibacter vanlangensis]
MALMARDIKLAMMAAEKAAPYVHQKLAAIDMNATVRRSITEFSDAELAALAQAEGDDGSEEGAWPPTGGPH